MSQLTITRRDAATGPVLEIVGELDYASAPDLRQALDTLILTDGQLLVLDLASLEYCDSSGLSALLAARNLATEHGARIALAAVPADTARILSLTGLDQVFPMHPDARATAC
ncbi:STAS domain-containing protein [Streptomyces sp. NBC_01558]|uniref:STAS domain-containing protein n=1 Tax=Streptomyces sp. NBC_01558 TaxID=2975878 RepID=UPI002DDBC250|nr:STAS domain-containing protein [Streptomyces sp. NBC_01558]WSD75018.1 STAS domain-containing protein [Streptomyces sp. NBC_01558]